MKTKLNIKRLIQYLLITVLALTTSSKLIAQDKKTTDLKNFKVVVEKTEKVIKMRSIAGSAWIDLAFTLNNGRPQAIDEYGMAKLNKISADKDSRLADFLFTIAKIPNGIILKGIEGTAWTELRFSLHEKEKQAIDQFGMTKLN